MLYSPQGKVVDIDTPADIFRQLIDAHFEGDLDYVVHLYYKNLLRMVELGGFDILGHADKMHYNASCYRPGLLDISLKLIPSLIMIWELSIRTNAISLY